LRDRTARERMAVLRAEVSASARSRAEKGGASGVLQILRRVESGVALRAARDSSAALVEEAARTNARAVRAAVQEGVERLEQALA
jgi:hypothetical protein